MHFGVKGLTLVFLWSLLAAVVQADQRGLDYPHNSATGTGCNSCHYYITASPSWLDYVPGDSDDTYCNKWCWSCHNNVIASRMDTHSSNTTSTRYGSWSVECRVCHWPHHQSQLRAYGADSYLVSGTSAEVTAYTLRADGVVWQTNAYAGNILIPDTTASKISYQYKILSNTSSTITVKSGIDSVVKSAGKTFAVIYGKLIKSTIKTPNSGDKVVKFIRPTGTNSFADGGSVRDGVCEVCHTKTTHYRNDSSGSDPSHANLGGKNSTDCTDCHLHQYGFAHGAGAGGGSCANCHGHDAGSFFDADMSASPLMLGIVASSGAGTYQSHSTHTETTGDDLRGPGIYCDTCHDITSMPKFKKLDGTLNHTFAETDICNNCHSAGGTYDGVNNATYGAKANWSAGIYNGNSLKAGKEKWCASCHDESPASSNVKAPLGVLAPNIVGNESGAYTYGSGWGYYKTGHGLANGQKYPASGGVVAGAGFECASCHDLSLGHIDGNARTFGCDDGCDSTEYKNGYRLKLVDGLAPMQIPLTTGGGNTSDQARLCYSCHNSGPFLDSGNMNTNLISEGVNRHEYHLNLPMQTRYPADYNYGGSVNSRITCVNCHNVHGSTRLAMVNDGKLIAREPGLQMWYRNDDIVSWSGSSTNPPDPESLPLSASNGTLILYNTSTNLCGHCHAAANLNAESRAPYQSVQQAPTLAWTGQSGYETDGVNPDSALGSSSFTFRVKYTDTNNDSPVLYQVWIDLDNDDIYEVDEKFDMGPVNPGDANYYDGKFYKYSTTIAKVGTLKYTFRFADASAIVTGAPTADKQLTTTNNAPAIAWTGEQNYTADGVNPNSGLVNGHFIFRVKYTDIDNNAPSEIKVTVDGSTTNMTEVDAGDTTYTDGKLYYADVVLASTGGKSYSFSAKDSSAQVATGDPTGSKTVTVTNGANAPTLAWTDESGYTTDGVQPDNGAKGSHYLFRIKYTDIDNNPPSEIKVWVDGSATNMTEVDTNDTEYSDGKLFFADLILSTTGNRTYSFNAKDSNAQVATGDPTGSKTVSVSNALTVCDTGCGYTTIQSAINASSNGDIVVVSDGTYSERVNFNGKLITVQSVNGATFTKITGDNTNNQVVTFSSGETASAVLDGFTIDNQYGTNTQGRGIYISNSSAPTIRNCVIQGNKLGTGSDGAGMYINGGTVTIDSTTFGGDSANTNTCRNGCGIYATSLSAALNISNSSFSWNSGTYGSGLYLSSTSGTTTVSNTRFHNNTVTQYGGALYSSSSPVVINNNSSFIDNSSGFDGAAINLSGSSSTVTIDKTIFSGNTGRNGGGIYTSNSGDLTISNSVFIANNITGNGGGMSLNSMTSSVVVTNTNFVNNTSTMHGAGIYMLNSAAITLTNCRIDNNTVTNTASYDGGGILLSGASISATISNSTFNGNTARNGGGIYASVGDLNATSITTSGNTGALGGGLYFSGTSLNVSKSVINGNKSTIAGGGIYAASGTITVTNSFITGNDCEGTSNDGGGIYSTGTLTISSCTIAGNYAKRNGGGLDGGGTITNSIIWGNRSSELNPQIEGSPTVTYSNIGQYGYAGSNGNINSDPLFADFIQAGSGLPTSEGDFHLMPTSPSRDTANNSDAPAVDIDGQTRPASGGDPADMGADEYLTPEAVVPVVTVFTVSTSSTSLVIPVSSFTATDNVGVTGYRITTSSTAPSILGGGWYAAAPTTYNVETDGTYTLYPWARDAAGNVSTGFGSPRTVVVNSGAPSVSSTTPANGASNIALNSTVTINWNEYVDCTTINTSSVTISPSVGWTKTSCSGSQAVFTPSGQSGSITYTVMVAASIKDSVGNSMTASYPLSYTTVPPTVAAPTIGTPTAQSTTSIRWNFTDNASNEEGFKVHDASHTVKASVATPNLTYLDETGLTANTQYTRHVHAYKTGEDSLGSADASAYTLPVAPNVTADKTTSVWYTSGEVIFTNAAGFGAGGVQYYRYVWDKNTTYSFNDNETQWSSSTLTKTSTSEGSWYLHVKAYNGDDVANGTQNYGPYNYDASVLEVSSTTPVNGASGILINSNVTINWNENVDCSTVNTTNITISGGGWTLSSCSDSQAVFTTSGQSINTSYTVRVSTDVKEPLGSPMGSNHQFSYSTAAVSNYAPTLSWTGEVLFVSDGVDPNTGASGGRFTFRVQYADQEGTAPTSMQVWIDKNDDGDYLDANEKIDMDAVASGSYTTGKLYTKTVNLTYAGDGVINFRFYASDGTGDAVGTPASNSTLTIINNPRTVCASGCTHTTISAAITAASSGEYILVKDGTYSTQADYGAKNLFIQSENGAATTTITGSGGNVPIVNLNNAALTTAVLDGFTIDNSSAAASAARGIYIGSSATPIIKNSIIEGNLLSGCAENGNLCGGGGVYITGSTATFSNCTIRKNTATNRYGAGLYITGAASGAVLHRCTVGGDNDADKNYSANYGGGIYFTGSTTGSLTITNSTIKENESSADGSGIYLNSITNVTTITDSSVSNSSCTGNCYGGGIYSNGSPVRITNSHVDSNVMPNVNRNGGGIYMTGAAAYLIVESNSTINNNYTGNGGGIYITGSTASTPLSISNSTISGNTTGYGSSGIYMGTLTNNSTFTNVTISNNACSNGFGGGIYAVGAPFTMTGSTISGNTAPSTKSGGGICVESTTADISSTTIQSNTAGVGGGIAATGTAPTLTLNKVKVLGNNGNATGGGGGVYNVGTATITNSVIAGNISSSGSTTGGGGIYNNAGTLYLYFSTVSDNYVGRQGGGIKGTGTETIRNSIVWGNVNPGIGGLEIDGTMETLYLTETSASPSFVSRDTASSGVPKTNGDYHLQSSSNCIDTGDGVTNPPDNDKTPNVDNAGNPRPTDISGKGDGVNDYDKGAYEYVQ